MKENQISCWMMEFGRICISFVTAPHRKRLTRQNGMSTALSCFFYVQYYAGATPRVKLPLNFRALWLALLHLARCTLFCGPIHVMWLADGKSEHAGEANKMARKADKISLPPPNTPVYGERDVPAWMR
jgi:hypothetical protein